MWENGFAGIDQTLLFGFEVGRQKSRNRRNTGTLSGDCLVSDGTVPLSDPNATWKPPGHLASDADNGTTATISAVYMQDQIRPTDWPEIVAGVRFDSFKLHVDDLRSWGRTAVSAARTGSGRRASASS